MNYFRIAKEQFLKDYRLKAFPKEKIKIISAVPFPNEAMKYLEGKPFLNMIYFGDFLFISADEKIREYITKYTRVCKNEIFRVFDAPNLLALNNELEKYGYTIAHMAQYFLPQDDFHGEVDVPYEIKIYEKESIKELYGQGFSMALIEDSSLKRKDILAVALFIDGHIAGVAGCSMDSDVMWQIGVDVKEKYRKKGIGTALVLRLKQEIIKLGKCPFYCCAWSNIASKRLARKAGFVDAWVELTAKSITEPWIKDIRNGSK